MQKLREQTGHDPRKNYEQNFRRRPFVNEVQMNHLLGYDNANLDRTNDYLGNIQSPSVLSGIENSNISSLCANCGSCLTNWNNHSTVTPLSHSYDLNNDNVNYGYENVVVFTPIIKPETTNKNSGNKSGLLVLELL